MSTYAYPIHSKHSGEWTARVDGLCLSLFEPDSQRRLWGDVDLYGPLWFTHSCARAYIWWRDRREGTVNRFVKRRQDKAEKFAAKKAGK